MGETLTEEQLRAIDQHVAAISQPGPAFDQAKVLAQMEAEPNAATWYEDNPGGRMGVEISIPKKTPAAAPAASSAPAPVERPIISSKGELDTPQAGILPADGDWPDAEAQREAVEHWSKVFTDPIAFQDLASQPQVAEAARLNGNPPDFAKAGQLWLPFQPGSLCHHAG